MLWHNVSDVVCTWHAHSVLSFNLVCVCACGVQPYVSTVYCLCDLLGWLNLVIIYCWLVIFQTNQCSSLNFTENYPISMMRRHDVTAVAILNSQHNVTYTITLYHITSFTHTSTLHCLVYRCALCCLPKHSFVDMGPMPIRAPLSLWILPNWRMFNHLHNKANKIANSH